jgi:hypothetical protein
MFVMKHHAMKACERGPVWLHTFLTLSQDGGERSALHPGHFIPSGNSPQYPWSKKLGDPKGDQETLEKEKFLAPAGK